jgi:hypothetical protein
MRRISLLITVFLVALSFSCEKDSLTRDLKGEWVRVDNSNQVITFGYLNNEDWFTLFNGYRIDNDGNQRKIKFLGEYAIKNGNDSISIHWMHSSLLVWPSYYFSLQGSKMEIGDLINRSDSIFVFEKVK